MDSFVAAIPRRARCPSRLRMDLSQMAQHLPPGMKMPSEDHMKKAMEDVTHMSEALKPLPEDPNRTIPVNEVLLALATAPCMCRIIPADVPSKISELEEAMRAEKVDMDWVDKASGAARNHAIAMLWQINRQRAALKEKDADLDGPTAQHASVAVQLATKLLVQAPDAAAAHCNPRLVPPLKLLGCCLR